MGSAKWIKLLIFFLLAGDTLMSQLNLRQPGFTYSLCETFTKQCERNKN